MALAQYTRTQACFHISFRSQIQLFHYLLNEYWLCLLNLNATIFTDHIKIANPKIIFACICLCIHSFVLSHLDTESLIEFRHLKQFNQFLLSLFFFFARTDQSRFYLGLFPVFNLNLFIFSQFYLFFVYKFLRNFQYTDNLDSVFVCWQIEIKVDSLDQKI